MLIYLSAGCATVKIGGYIMTWYYVEILPSLILPKTSTNLSHPGFLSHPLTLSQYMSTGCCPSELFPTSTPLLPCPVPPPPQPSPLPTLCPPLTISAGRSQHLVRYAASQNSSNSIRSPQQRSRGKQQVKCSSVVSTNYHKTH